MQAFHNDIAVKDKLIAHLKAHYDADEIIKGIYWGNGKGCAIGCAIHSNDHGLYEKLFDIPEWLARVQDRIFEGLPNDKAKKWPLLFTKSVKIGVDLNKIKIPFLMFVVESNLYKFDHKEFPKAKEYIDNILSALKNNNINTADNVAYDYLDANAADYDSVFSSASRYTYAATDAIYSVSAACSPGTENVSDAVYYSAYYDYDKEKSYEIFADKLIELIENV